MFPMYTEVTSRIGFLLARKLPRIDDHKGGQYTRIWPPFVIVDPRGFGAAESRFLRSLRYSKKNVYSQGLGKLSLKK